MLGGQEDVHQRSNQSGRAPELYRIMHILLRRLDNPRPTTLFLPISVNQTNFHNIFLLLLISFHRKGIFLQT
jgi:hypothetical protein